MSRSRWAAVGAAVAVSVGGGGLLTASAASTPSGGASSTISIVPCRFLDTRLSTGERTSPISGGETIILPAHGTHGGCTLPVDATALVANVTTVNQSDSGYLSVFPTGADRPTISVLNWSAGDGATGNEVTMKLSADGSFSVYNFAGSADVVIDVVAYLVPASSGIGPKGDTGIQGIQGIDGAAGLNGVDGDDGAAGLNGKDGTAGLNGVDGEDGVDGTNGAPGIDGKNGLDGAPGGPTYSYGRINGSGQVDFDLGLGFEFYGRCDASDGTTEARVSVRNLTTEVATVVHEDGSTENINMFQMSDPASGSFGSHSGISSSTILTRGANAWEVNAWIDIDPQAATCDVHSTVTVLDVAV